MRATGEEQDDVRACGVNIGRAISEAELQEAAGGPGAAACSGDRPLGARADCSRLTAQAVAESVDVDVSVEASGDLDLRGTLGIDGEVRVEDVRLEGSVDGNLEEDTRAALRKYTERYCVVYRTLDDPPGGRTVVAVPGGGQTATTL